MPANLICRSSDIWKNFREALGLRGKESRLYSHKTNTKTKTLISRKGIINNIITKETNFAKKKKNNILTMIQRREQISMKSK